MARRKSKMLTEVEAELMAILWDNKEASVQEVCTALDDKPAYTTVATMLGILEKKGYLAHKIKGRTYVYYPVRGKSEERSNVLRHIVQRFFDGSLKSLLAHMVKGTELSKSQLEELKKIIEKAEKE